MPYARLSPTVTISELFTLSGKVALVVGGSRHLGYDMAEALAEAGAAVVVTSRDLSAAKAAAESLKLATETDTLGLALDHLDYRQVHEVFKEAAAWKGRFDILINNAGGGVGDKIAALFDRDPNDVREMIENNLLGPLQCCQEAAKIMVAQRTGKIINIASVAALVGRDRRIYERNGMRGQPIDYAAAKAGVLGMTRDLAGLLSPMGICVNAISPGGFKRESHSAGFVKDYSELTPLGRMGRDGVDLKGAALFLSSAASDYVTGQNLVVDGGFSLWR